MYLCREPRCFANAITESFGIIKGFGWLAEMLMCSLFSLCASVCTPSKKVMEGSVLSPPHRKVRMDWFAHQIHRIPPSVRRCCCRVGRLSFLLSVTVRMFLTRCDDSQHARSTLVTSMLLVPGGNPTEILVGVVQSAPG